MKHKLILIILLFSTMSIAQNRCGTTVNTQHMMQTIPEFATAKTKVNIQTKQWIANNTPNTKTTITIPVVVHVVWNTNNQNISDAQIQSQIEVLNADFSRTNIDAINTPSVWQNIAADCNINFCLATIDPNGNTTTGITRTQTTESSFSMIGDPVKSTADGGVDPWPQDDYLNIWVCKLTGGILGYATPPSGWNNPNDGVVIGYNYFGLTSSSQYGKGRTATHEIGHWLNLEHIWGDNYCGDDLVNDTPEHEQDNYGCPSFPKSSSCTGTGANGEMFMNYMDYTNDACMNLFTEGQKTRMIAAINQYRSNLLNHNLCTGSVGFSEHKSNSKQLIEIIDVLGRATRENQPNTPLFYIYDDGTVEKKIIIE